MPSLSAGSASTYRKRQHLIRAEEQPQADAQQSGRLEEAAEIQPDKRGQVGDLDRALSAVNTALKDAEGSLQNVDRLPSANLKGQMHKVLEALSAGGRIAAAVVLMMGIHACGWPVRVCAGILAGAAVGYFGYQTGSLSSSGAKAAAFVGGATFAASFRAASVLLTFFYTSSKLTTYCEDRKLDDESFKKGGQRDWKQVACNGLVPTLLALRAVLLAGLLDAPLSARYQLLQLQTYTAVGAAFLGYYACCCGDTWASEVGQLSEDTPRLITTLRPVRKGTNGGVTRLGLLASAAGGLCLGLTFYGATLLSPHVLRNPVYRQAALRQLRVIPFGLAAGFAGSLVDSLLGATIQFTGYNRATAKITSKVSEDVTPISGLPILDNNAVNFVSASLVAMASAALAPILL